MYHHEQGSSPPSDTRTGEKSPKRTPLEHVGGLLEHAGCQPPADWCCALSRGAAATAQPIAPVIPSPGRVAGAVRAGPSAVRPLPMAGPAAALSVPAGVVYGTGRIDASGRVTDQAVSSALGWREGDRLTLTASPGIVTARREAGGMVTVRPGPVSRFPPSCAATAACGPVTGCSWPRSPARTCSLLTRSPWWTWPSEPTACSRMPQEDSRDNPAPGRAPGRIPAGHRRRRAADAAADGPVA